MNRSAMSDKLIFTFIPNARSSVRTSRSHVLRSFRKSARKTHFSIDFHVQKVFKKVQKAKVINKHISLYFVDISTLSAVLGYFFFSATNTLIYRLFLGGWWVSDSKDKDRQKSTILIKKEEEREPSLNK